MQIEETTCAVVSISLIPKNASAELSDYARHVGSFSEADWVYAVQTDALLPDGFYSAKIIVESVSPMSFVVN